MRFLFSFCRGGVVAACATAAFFLLAERSVHAEILYGLSSAATLVSFDSSAPGTTLSSVTLSGVASGQILRAIDFRPSNGQLYALSSVNSGTAAQLYTVDLSTGALTTIGGGLTLTGNTSSVVSMDFNPVADALRVVTGSSQNYRVSATTGALIAQDTNISNGTIGDIAYSNNAVGAGATTLYAYDYSSFTNTIGTIGGINGVSSGGPNGGVYASIGGSGQSAAEAQSLGFDISGLTGVAYVSLNTSPAGILPSLYTVNLSTGALTSLGSLPIALGVRDISARITPVAAPEPGALSLLGMGLATGMGLAIRKRQMTDAKHRKKRTR